ncbi:MAG: methyltransferase domain-containing protein [Prolixibacteraceae bacterium]
MVTKMDYKEINKRLWNDKTNVHFTSDFYDVDSFLKGRDTLNPVETELLGNINDKSILHLQCHFGLDTISLSRHGALVTGVDFSDNAITRANQLKETLGTNTRFIQSDIYNLTDNLHETFDVVFTSYGVIGWLPDMKKWAETIAHFLKPGGIFVMVEFHPVIWMFSYDFKNIAFNYMDSSPIIEELEGTYADRKSGIKSKSVAWNHGLGYVIDSIIKSGLELTDFKEYDYSPYDCFENTVRIGERRFQIRGLENKIPMMYSIKATKKK